MTYPFMDDPVPPGHGETGAVAEAGRTYRVVVTLADGVSNREKGFGDPTKAFEEADRARAELVLANYRTFHVGVIDDDDPERGYLSPDDIA